jgi:hypothetical protein
VDLRHPGIDFAASAGLLVNEKKSLEKEEEINGIKCSSTVKYLGVRVAVDRKEQIKISKE